MVAIFTGLGAGFERGSGAALGGGGLLGSSSLGRGGEGVLLNAANGNLVLQRQDEFLVGRGPDVAIARTYNSLGQLFGTPDDNGDLWRQSTDRRIRGLTGTVNTVGSTVKRLSADGSEITFTYDDWDSGAGTDYYYRATDGAGAHDKLVYASATDAWTWTDGSTQISGTYAVSPGDTATTAQHALVLNSESLWRIQQQRDPDGNALTFTYVAGAYDKLKSVTTSVNGVAELIEYEWGAGDAENYITKVTVKYDHDFDSGTALVARSRTTYDYDSNRLTSVTVDLTPEDTADSSAYTTTYTYDASGRVATIGQTDGSSLAIGYDGSGRVITLAQTVESGTRTTTISYTDEGNGLLRTEITDPRGNVTKIWSRIADDALTTSTDERGQLVRVMAPPATAAATPQEVNYTYDGDGNVTSVVSKSGPTTLSTISYQYDERGNATRIVDANGNVTLRTYDAANQLVRQAVAAGNLLDNPGGYPKQAFSSTSAYEPGGIPGWFFWTNDANGGHAYSVNTGVGAEWLANGDQSTFVVRQTDNQTGSVYQLAQRVSVSVGESYMFSAYTGAHRADVEVFIAWRDAAGQILSETHGPAATAMNQAEASGGQSLSGYKRIWVKGTAPQGAVEASVILRKHATKAGHADSWMFVTRPQLELVAVNATGPIDWIDTSALLDSSAVQFTRYVYDSEHHLRFAISGEGRVTEYTYTPTGEVDLVREFTKDAHRYEVGATAPDLSAMEAWVTGLGDLSSAKVTKNVYDLRGNLKETHGYGAATSSGLGATGEGTAKTTYGYDLHGRLLSRKVGAQASESFVYDGLGRLILSTDLAGRATSIAFNDAANTTTVVTLAAYNATSDVWEQIADSYVTISTYNTAGELLSVQDYGSAIGGSDASYTAGGTSTHLYDKNGQLRVSIDATGRKSYFLYDKAGRKIADIGHDGQVIEYRYDEGNRLVGTARFQNKLTSTQLTTLGDPNSEVEIASIRPAAHSWDIWQWSVYDAGGRVIETIMGDGSVTTYEYDQADRLVKTQGFYNKLASVSAYFTTPPTALVLPAADANRDVVIRTFYDRDGRVIGSLNAEGALTRVLYDSAGQKIQDIAYANLTDPNQRASGTFDQLLASFSPDANRDVSNRYVYDGQGLLRFTIDALSRVTEYVYWEGASGTAQAHAHGLVRKTIVHSTPISVSDHSYATVKANLAIDGSDRVSYAVYNERAQLRYSVDALGGVTELTYDSSGRVAKTTQYAVSKATVVPTDSTTWEAHLDSWRQGAGIAEGARITRTYYAERGEARYVVDAEGYVTQNDYDAEGRLLDQYRFANKIVVSDASTIADVAAANKGGSVVTQYRYDNLGRLQDVYDPNGVRRSKAYYANGALGHEIVAWGQGGDEQRIQYIYDQAGKVITERRYTSEISNATSLGATATQLVQATRITSPNGQYAAVLTREGGLQLYHKGELIWTNGVREEVSGATYSLVAQTDGNLVIYRHVQGQAAVGIWASNTAGSHSGATYIEMRDDGNLVFHKGTAPTSQGAIWSTNTAGVVAQNPNAAEYFDTVTTYDGLGNVASIKDARNNTTTFTYDKAGRVLTKTDPLSGVTSFEYDAFGRGVKVTDARGNANHAYFDRLGRVTVAVDSERGVTRTTYNAFGEVEEMRRHQNLASGELSVTAPPAVTNHALDAVVSRQFDKLGRVVSEIDPEGGVTAFQYDALGNVVKKTDALGHASYYYYDKLNRLDLEIDAESYATVNTYNSTGTIASTARRYNRATNVGNVAVRPTLSTHALDATTSFTYDGAGQVRTRTDAEGNVTQLDYDRRGNLVKVTAPGGAVSYNYYDKFDRLVLAIDAEGYATRTQYLPTGEVRQVTRYAAKAIGIGDVGKAPTLTASPAEDRVTTFAYDALGRVLSTTDAMGGVVSYEYDKNGNVVKIIDARGNASYNYYDKLNRVILAVDAEGYATATTYQATGEVKTVTRRYGRVQGAVTTAAPPTVPTHTLDATTTFDYDKVGRVTKVKDALEKTEEYTLDALGNRVEVKNKLGGITYNTFDKRGLLKLERLPVEAFDAEGGPPLSAFVENAYEYDARGNLIQKVEASNLGPELSRTTTYEYDRLGRRTATIGEAVAVTAGATAATVTIAPTEQAKYDARGNVIETIAADGARNLFWYDKLDRVTHKLSALGTLTRYEYDDASDNVAKTHTYPIQASLPDDATGSAPNHDPLGTPRTTEYDYDKLGRVIEQRVLGVTTAALGTSFAVTADSALITKYEYDANGNVVLTTDANGGKVHAYFDKLRRKIAQIDAAGYRTSWIHDTNGNVLAETRYANQGSVPSVVTADPPSPPAAHAQDRVTDFTYDKMGRRLTETRRGVLTYANQSGQVVQAPQDAIIVYTYNEAGQVETKTEASGDALTYTYDLGGRLIGEERAAFTDFNGTQVTPSVEYFYGGLDQLMRTEQAGNASAAERVTRYAYDSAGRMTSMTDAENFVRTYFYDIAGRVRREEYVRVTPTGSVEEAVGYDYDAEGRVVEQGALLKQSGDWARAGANIGTAMMTYNAFGEVSTRGVNGVYAEEFEYDAAGRLQRTNAGDGVWKYFVYDAVGNQTLMLATVGEDFSEADGDLDTLGEVLALWGGDGSTIATVGKTGIVATITKYDARNQAIEVREPKREVHVNGALTPSDLVTTRAYNAFGEVTHEINAAGARVDYTYNTMGRLIKTESPAVSVTGEDGAVTNDFRPTEHLYYDAAGRLVASRDANNYVTSYTLLAGTGYGGAQALHTEVFTPDGAVTRTRYDIHGDARRIEDPLYDSDEPTLHVTTQNFDRMGRLVQMTRAASLTQSLTDYYAYDGLGHRIKHANSFYNSTVVGNPHYNANFNALNPATWNNAASTAYDHQGRVVQVVAAGGDTTKYAYAWDGTLLANGMSATPFGGWVKTTTFANGKALTEKTDVFGREVGKIDMSAHTTHFTYDKAGRLIQRNGTQVVNGNTVAWGHTLYQSYYNTGRLKEIYQPFDWYFSLSNPGGAYLYSDIAISYRGSIFGYDKAGNVVSQVLSEAGTHTWQMNGPPGEPGDSGSDPFTFTISSQTASYDALGRIVSWSEAGSGQFFPSGAFHYRIGPATHAFVYDANGNIRRSLATYRALDAQGVISSNTSTQDYWYLYDSMNRMITSKGVFVGTAGSGSIQRGTNGGVDTFYNLDGTRAHSLTSSSALQHRREDYVYDALGRVIEVKSGTTTGAAGAKVGEFSYDALSRLLTQTDYNGTSGYIGGTGATYSRTVVYNDKNQIVSDDVSVHTNDNTYRTLSTYDYGDIVLNGDGSVNAPATTYALGSAIQVDADGYKDGVDGDEPDRRTKNFYHWYDGAVAASITHDKHVINLNNPEWDTNNPLWTTTYGYDVIGGQAQLETASIADGRPRTVVWTNDMLGQVIRRSEKDNQAQAGDPHEIWHRMSGRQMGYVGNNGNYDVTYFTSRHQRQTAGGPGTGSFADFDLAHDHINSYEQGARGGVYTAHAGDTLSGIAANLWGDASLWYKIAEVNGLTAESVLIEGQPLLIPTGVQRNENNATTFQPYDPLEVLGNTSPTSPTPSNVKECGTAGKIMLAIVTFAVAYWVDPYLANAVQQGLMIATGHQEEFSWEQFAAAAITAGITSNVSAGVSTYVSNATGSAIAGAAAGGAVGSAVSQGVSMALGVQEKFSWAAVAGAAAGAAAGEWAMPTAALKNIGAKFGAESNQFASANFIRASASGVANAATRSLMNDGDFGDNMLAALPDVVGQMMAAVAGAQREAQIEPVVAEELQLLEPNLMPIEDTPRYRMVQDGDSFWKIAGGDRQAVLEWMEANREIDPLNIPRDYFLTEPADGIVVSDATKARLDEADGQYREYLSAQQANADDTWRAFNQASLAFYSGGAQGGDGLAADLQALSNARGALGALRLVGLGEVAPPIAAISAGGMVFMYTAVAVHGAPLMIPRTSLMHPDEYIGSGIGAAVGETGASGGPVILRPARNPHEESIAEFMRARGWSEAAIDVQLRYHREFIRDRIGRTAEELRNSPGTAFASGKLPEIGGQWLRGTEQSVGIVPAQVAERLTGQRFESFDDFREAFWRTVGDIPEFANQFSPRDVAGMQYGRAPVALPNQQHGGLRSYVLHHKDPIQHGGAVYDMSNILIVSPLYHQQVLDPSYHYGKPRKQ